MKLPEQQHQGVKCSATILNQSILLLAFKGFYPYGSKGNEIAQFMSVYTQDAYTTYLPDAILFDLEGLVYEWGDAICGLIVAVRRAQRALHELPLTIPTCVLAQGDTHDSLAPLFEDGWPFDLFGTRLTRDREEALSYLVSALDEQHPSG